MEFFKFCDMQVAGMRYHTDPAARDDLAKDRGCVLALVSEPTNKFDPCAVKVVHQTLGHVGYIPRTESGMVARMLEHGYDIRCKLNAVDTRNLTAVITLALPSLKDQGNPQ
jgi:hypothetical protein